MLLISRLDNSTAEGQAAHAAGVAEYRASVERAGRVECLQGGCDSAGRHCLTLCGDCLQDDV